MLLPGGTRARSRPPRPEAYPWTVSRTRLGRAWASLAAGHRSSLVVLALDLLALAAYLSWQPGWWKSLLSLWILTVVGFANASQYRPRLHLSLLDDAPVLIGRWMFAAALVALGVTRLHGQEVLEDFVLVAAVTLPIHLGARGCAYYGIRLVRARRLSRNVAVVIGSGAISRSMVGTLARKRSLGLDIAGYLDERPEPTADPPAGWTHLGTIDDLHRIVQRYGVGAIIMGYGYGRDGDAVEVLRRESFRPPTIFVVPRLFEIGRRSYAVDHIGAVPVIRLPTRSMTGPRWMLKRAFDVVVSLSALVVLAPVLVLVALAVRLDGPGPVLFRQQRVGRDGVFTCYKFRSLVPVTKADAEVRWSIAADDRVSRVGRFIRRTSLDECPQLFNVLRGDMTIVGPRPERPVLRRALLRRHPALPVPAPGSGGDHRAGTGQRVAREYLDP